MLKKRRLTLLILFLLALSLTLISFTATLTPFAKVQAETVNISSDTVPSEMKFVKEFDLLQSTSEIIYVWCYTEFGYFDVFVYSEEYDETTGTYYYVLSNVEKIYAGTWQTKWQIVLDTPIVWGRVADVDGDYAPEVITIPSTENLTIIYDDSGEQLMNFTIPEYKRALVITDWTGDGINDVVLIEGVIDYISITVFDIYHDAVNSSLIFLPSAFYVGEAFAGDWDLSSPGMEIAILETKLYYGDSASMIILTGNMNITVMDLPYGTCFSYSIALSYEYMAFSFYDSATDKHGVAVLHNGSVLWYYQTPWEITGLQITELDGDVEPELIVMMFRDEVMIFDIERTPPKTAVPAYYYPFALPIDFDYDGIYEVILFQNGSGLPSHSWDQPFSESFGVLYWRPKYATGKSVLLNSTTLSIVSNITLPEELSFVFLPPVEYYEVFLGVSEISSQILSTYSFKEAVPPVLNIVSPSDGSYVGVHVDVNVSAYDEHSGIYNITLLVNNTPVDILAYLLDTYSVKYYTLQWNAENYVDGTYNLTVVVYDNVDNTASKSILVYLDKNPPIIGTVSPANKSWVSGVVTISVPVNDLGSGVAYVAFYTTELPPVLLYNDTEEPYEYSWDTKPYAEGIQHLTVYIVDNVGNYRLMTLEYYVDNTPPVISSVEYPSEVKEGEDATINVTVTDVKSGVSKVILSCSGFNGEETRINITMTEVGDGVYKATIPWDWAAGSKTVQFKVIAIDVAGNVAVSQTYSYGIVSKVAPPSVAGVTWTLMIGVGMAVAVVAAVVFIMVRRRSK